MINPNIPYLAFDDRLLMLLAIPLLALIIPFVFFGVSLQEYLGAAPQEYIEGLSYTAAFWFFNRFLMIVLRRRFQAFEDTVKRLALQLAIIAVAVPVISVSMAMLFNAIYRAIGSEDLLEPTLFQGLSSTYVLTFAIAMFYEAIYFFHKFREAIQEKDRIQMAHIQGQLDNLRNQINPHFLFNSLNTLMNLIPTDPGRAMNYLDKLSKFYRYAVSNHDQQLAPLPTELDNTRIYAALLQERFHDGIRVDLPEAAPGNARILPLSLQLLIENAVKHNIVSRKKPLHIEVSIADGGKAVLVQNNIQKKIREDNSTGVGLKNIRSRMAFFTEAPLTVTEEDGRFTVAIPLIFSSQYL